MEKQKYFIPRIPEECFKYRAKTEGGSQNPIRNVPVVEKIEAHDRDGFNIYWKGFKYPKKGWPESDILDAANIVKRLFRN